MADTVRSRAAILALLADNTTGDISPQDIRDMFITAHGVYGEIRVEAGVTAQSSIDTTPAKVTGWNTNGLSSGTTPDHATDNDISVLSDGIYHVSWSLSCDSPTASTTFEFEIFKNGAAQGHVSKITTNVTPDNFCISGGGLISCSANDNLQLYVSANAGSKAITPTEGVFRCHRIA